MNSSAGERMWVFYLFSNIWFTISKIKVGLQVLRIFLQLTLAIEIMPTVHDAPSSTSQTGSLLQSLHSTER